MKPLSRLPAQCHSSHSGASHNRGRSYCGRSVLLAMTETSGSRAAAKCLTDIVNMNTSRP